MVTRTGNMKCDMIETPTEYKISAELPGMLKENINIDIDEGVLTISAAVSWRGPLDGGVRLGVRAADAAVLPVRVLPE